MQTVRKDHQHQAQCNTANTELLVLQEAARLITRAVDPAPAINGTLRLLSQLLGLNRGRVLLHDPVSGQLQIRYAYGLTDEERQRGVYGLGEGVTGRVFETGQTAVIQDIDDEPVYLRRAVERTTLPSETVAYLALPLMHDETPIGVLAVHRLRNRDRPFMRDISLLQVVAVLIAQMLRVNQLVSEHTAALQSENRHLKESLEGSGAAFGIIGESPALQHAIRQAHRVSDTRTTVMLQGESGTGKEKFARMLHLGSSRRDAPFISINCAAIPATLIEAELFGHEKGSFTGASQTKRGRIEQASGGTLFLDEIGDLDLDLQSKLLRVLEQQVIQRVGGSRDIPVDVRIVAATHKNLQEAVNAGTFRLDLFYRLNVFPLRLPSLRERGADVGMLARHFLNMANQEYDRNVQFAPGVLDHLESYNWPGNIRQLENVVKRVVILAPESVVTRALVQQILVDEASVTLAEHRSLPRPAVAAPPPAAALPPTSQRPYSRVSGDEASDIRQALADHRGNKTRAAYSLGYTPRQLRYRMQKLGIEAE